MGDTTLMAVAVSTRPTLTIGKPQRLFFSRGLSHPLHIYRYDITPDGQQFVLPEAADTGDTTAEAESGGGPQPSIRIVQNWFAEFKDRQQD